ncbi:MAG: U32 family peptidase C-terminal domain-containing protein [Christensenellaceae bacterium]|nr:U32 family peptidase C-terminal domain-containing protein [Christensenellaceae bacterium]
MVEQKNKFSLGEELLLLSPEGLFPFQATEMRDEGGEALASAPHPEQRLHLPLPKSARPGDLILREMQSEGELL